MLWQRSSNESSKSFTPAGASTLEARPLDGHSGWHELVVRALAQGEETASLAAQLDAACKGGLRNLLVTAAGGAPIDVVSVVVLLRLLRRLIPQRGRVVLCELPPHTERTLEIVQARRLFEVQPTRADALRQLATFPLSAPDQGMVDEALRRLEVLLPAGAHRPVRPEERRMRLMKAAFAAYGKWVGDVGVPQGPSASERVSADVRKIVERVSKNWTPPPEPADVDHVTKLLVADLLGVGPIEELLHEPGVSEIMVNGPSNVLVERRGRIEQTEIVFRDAEHLVSTIRKIADRSGRRIDYASPTLDSFLEDGSRVHALLPPLALDGPCLTIRKFGVVRAQLDDLITRDTLNSEMAYFLAACVKARLNIIIGGPASSGKTTTMNALTSQVPESERMVTIEEVAEMDLSKAHSHVVRLQARGPNVEGRGEVTIRQLVREALRMRADRIIVGEARGEEMVEVLQALRCGHDGSMTTIHASSPDDLIERAVTIALFANLGLSDETLRRMVVDGLDVIVFQYRFPDGQRKIIRICEPYRNARGEVAMNDVFIFNQLGYDPAGRAQGHFQFVEPSRHEARFQRQGIVIPWEQLSRGD